MLPTHIVATRASLRIWSEKGVWNIRPKTGRLRRVGLPGRDVDEVDAGLGERLGDLDRVVAGDAALRPSRSPRCGPTSASAPATPRACGRTPRAESAAGSRPARHTRPSRRLVSGEMKLGEQVAVGAVELDHVEADALVARSTVATNSSTILVHVGAGERARHLALRVIGDRRGRRRPASCRRAAGATSPSHISFVEALRPAWPICRQNFAVEFWWTKSTMRFHAASCSSFHRPVQPGLIRASAETLVISVKSSPAPPIARAP